MHRDIKAANVLLDGEMHARVSDVGLAREMSHHITQTQGMGTFGYMDPEYMETGELSTSKHCYPQPPVATYLRP